MMGMAGMRSALLPTESRLGAGVLLALLYLRRRNGYRRPVALFSCNGGYLHAD